MAGLLALFGLLVFIMEQIDNRNPLVIQPPDKNSSFVQMMDLGDLVESVTPDDMELKFVRQGSGSGTGSFKHDRDPSVYRGILLEGASSRNHIQFEITADAEMRGALLSGLRVVIQQSLSRWQPHIEVKETVWPDDVVAPEAFVLCYRSEVEAGSYEGEIRVTIEPMPTEIPHPADTGTIQRSLSIVAREDRWAGE